MLRRLHPEQPESFAFTPGNQEWAEKQLSKYPPERKASAVIPLLWRAQEQEGWVTKPAIESIADMLDMASIRVLEVASFYFMFQLQPVGSVAHIQICGTTSCMICGSENLIEVCQAKIAANPHEISADGKFSWEEVECLGACSNAPMAQIGKDYYENLTAERLGEIIDALGRGEVPRPGPQNGRFGAEPFGGLTSLTEGERRYSGNASVGLAEYGQDTIKRIDGTEPALKMPMLDSAAPVATAGTETDSVQLMDQPEPVEDDGLDAEKPETNSEHKAMEEAAEADEEKVIGKFDEEEAEEVGTRPETLTGPRDGQADDLKKIKGVGPKLEESLNKLGFYHFDQIASWTEEELLWVDSNMDDFKGRASRDDWVGQSKLLAAGEETEFSKRVDDGDVYD